MIRVMEGHEVFGPLQLRRIDWKQEMFMEEEELGREQGVEAQSTGKASSSGQHMELDIEVKAAAAVVDATKVAEEKEPEKGGDENPSWDDVEEDATL